MVGKQLGQYEIVEALGAGGMGEVYRARDTQLHREVAIKVLPHSLARDPDRLASFRQEARTLAGIQHPNIAAVYGLDQADGVQFFAQELISGEDLAARLEHGPLEINDVLSIALQMASGLEAAHAAGVVHRDLKPANVMITPDGTVKILDFGLATPAIEEEDAAPPVTDESTPTLSSLQADNVIFGTPAYMSPDQARGRLVDSRSDIWSFGCVLYELLTGRRAFGDAEAERGDDTLLDTLSAVVRAEPDWDALPPSTPPRLELLLRRCLRKKVHDRLQHAGDARIEIEDIQADPALVMGRDAEPTEEVGSRRVSPLPLLAVAALAALAGWAVTGWWAESGSAGPPLHASLTIPDDALLVVDSSVSVAIAPDRSRVAYVARVEGVSRLHLQSLTRRELTILPATGETNNPFFSPDGDWIGFFVQNQRLVKMPADGGAAFEICDVPSGNWGATWLADDTIVYAPAFTGSGLMRVPAAGGEPEPLIGLDPGVGEVGQSRPQALPGGRYVLFTSRRADGAVAAVVDLTSGSVHEVLPGAVDAQWSSTGHLLFSRDGELYAIRFDPESLATTGTPQPLVSGLFIDPQSGEARFDLGGGDTLVYVPGEASPAADRLVWVSRDGVVEPLDTEPGDYGHPRLSPDGSAVAVDRTSDGRGDIWVYDLQRQGMTRLTRRGDNRMPIWQPDGLRIAFAANVGGTTGIFWKSADGSGDRHVLLESDYSLWPRSWRDDAIAYYEIHPETGRDIWALADAGGSVTEPRAVVQTPANERAPALSPDGRWLAFVSDESGQDQIYVQAFRGSPARTTVSIEGGREPVWSRDGTELFYRHDDRIMSVPVELGEAFVAGTPTVLFEGAFKADRMGSNQYFDVDLDGSRFLMIERGGSSGGPDHLHVIVGFAQRLRDLPSGQ